MRILVAAVGRARASEPARALADDYASRLRWPITFREVEERRKLPTARRIGREGELLLALVPESAVIVALDERGRQLASIAFADKLRKWQERGIGDLAFMIGGADGHADAVRQRAELVLSLGTMTWPHLLVRALLAEQLYRAQTILDGHPYHRE
ncbi:MAG: 23S rRNA (pseudouridine(1915)-N(3))-methyltransferase RlmH [Alphaproteobacteria bacterium]|nr:23S rRNA (pseudouridine(1915)-N(3))-methyltransferase RlmH [Alphaproteobacteria bacterium]